MAVFCQRVSALFAGPPEGRALPARRRMAHAAWALAALFALLAGLYSLATPLFEASDELWHYPLVRHLAEGGGLPVQDPAIPTAWRQEGSQPPLYYALAALLTHWVPQNDLEALLPRNPHADIGNPNPDGNVNMVLHRPDERALWRGAALAVRLARGLSVLLGALTVLLAYALGLEALPRRPDLALAGAAIVALTPMFLFISGSVNNDNLLVTLSTAALWWLLRLLREEEKRSETPGAQRAALWRWAVLGVLIGLAALSKTSGLALFAPAGLTLAWLAWRRRDLRCLLGGGLCLGGAALAVAGWWYWRNWQLYGDPLGLNMFVAIVGGRYPQPTLRQLLGEWRGFVMAYWGFFGGLNVAAPTWFYGLLNALALVGLGGLLGGAARRLWQRQIPDAATRFRLALLALWPLVVGAALVRWTLMTIASQGRLIFPAIAALSWLLALGLSEWPPLLAALTRRPLPRRLSLVPLAAALALMAALALYAPLGVIAPAYARPRLLDEAELAAIPHRLDVIFDDKAALLGYDLAEDTVTPGEALHVTLYWRALAPMAENYSVFVHLLAENEIVIAQRNLYPGKGAFPTSQWQPGDAFADTYRLEVSPTALAPTAAQIEVGLYRHETGERLPLRGAQANSIRLGDLLVRAKTNGAPNPLEINLEDQIALVGYALDRTAARPGETLHLTLYWEALAEMDEDYTVFAQVLGGDHRIWAQKDSWPQDGAAPTSSWQPGQVIVDRYELALAPDTPAGVYQLQVGLYLSETMRRLNVLGPGGHVRDNRVLLNPVRVLP